MMGNAKEWVPVAIMSGVKSVNPEEQREGNAFGVSRPPSPQGQSAIPQSIPSNPLGYDRGVN